MGTHGQHLLVEDWSVFVAVKTQNVSNTIISGSAIVEPWKYGRKMVFLVPPNNAGLASGDDLTIKVARRRRGTSTWDPVYEPNGTTELKFTNQSEAAATGSLGARIKDGQVVIGELDLTRLKAEKSPFGTEAHEYDAIRLTVTNAVAQNVMFGCIAVVGDSYDHAGDAAQYEDLWKKQRYTAGDPDSVPA